MQLRQATFRPSPFRSGVGALLALAFSFLPSVSMAEDDVKLSAAQAQNSEFGLRIRYRAVRTKRCPIRPRS